METLVRSYVVMTLVLTLYAQYAQSPESRLKIEIQVYNYSGVSAATLQQAGDNRRFGIVRSALGRPSWGDANFH